MIEDEGAERRTPVTCADSARSSGRTGTLMSARSPVLETAIHVVSVAGCYSALYAIFFAPVLFTGRLLGAGDALLYYLPHFLVGTAFWDPLLMGGFPVAADPQAMSWYPLSILFAALGSWNGFVTCFGVCSGELLHIRIRAHVDWITAGVNGERYRLWNERLYDGPSRPHHHHPCRCLVAIDHLGPGECRRHGRTSWLVVGTVAVACGVLSGHPQISLYSLGLSTLYAFVRCFHAPLGRVRACGLYAAMVFLGIGLASLQLIPAAQLAQLSPRREMSFAIFVSYSLPLLQSLGLFFPYLFGGTSGEVYSMPYFGAPNWTELTGYVGLLTLILAVVGGFGKVQRKIAFFWVAVSLVAFSLVLGDLTPFAKAMYYLPGFNKFTVPARHFLEFTMALSVLAGLGFAAIKNQVTTRSARGCRNGGGRRHSPCWPRDNPLARRYASASRHCKGNPRSVGFALLQFCRGDTTLALLRWAR